MNYHLLVTCEILLTIVAPLIVFYRRGNWPTRTTTWCLLTIPILWYPTYAPVHELSHAAATYMAGGTVVYMKLIPSFWLGQFGRAWITQEGITQDWQILISTAAPYLLDLVTAAAGLLILRRGLSRRAFTIGFLFMLLCLRPAFDFLCETIGFVLGDRGDIYHIHAIIGSGWTWTFILFSAGLILYTIVIVLRRFVGFPGTSVDQPEAIRE